MILEEMDYPAPLPYLVSLCKTFLKTAVKYNIVCEVVGVSGW